jgi:hypothetical protein
MNRNRAMRGFAFLVLFFVGLLWSFRDVPSRLSRVLEISLIGAVVYLGILAAFIVVIRSAATSRSVVHRLGWWTLFILLAGANIGVWALLYRLL